MDSEITIKNIDKTILERLKFEANQQGLDIKAMVLQLIKKSLGLEWIKDNVTSYHDLDNLAGTWSDKEFEVFSEKIASFNEVEKDLWE